MPIIPAGPGVENEPEANPVFPKIQQSDVASPGFLDVAAASERSSNLVGQLYDRYIDHPKPDAAAEPGFNPVDHVPSGYLHDYGSRFLDATNPAQVQWIKDRIDSERADGGVIARAKGWGIASSLAAGITDPLTLSSMALIPEAAPTRLGNALRWATMNAATTAGQEAIGSSLSETRDVGDAALNVGASSVLGGVLGSIARRVPAAMMKKTAADLHPELRPGGTEDVLGPNQRSVLSDINQTQNLADKFRSELTADHPAAVEKYNALANPEIADTQGGKILNVDMARELSPEYAEDRSLSAEVHEPASEFIKKVYAEKLAQAPKEGETNSVLFTAGGSGAGKSSAIENVPEVNNLAHQAQIIYDSNFTSVASATQKIEQAIGAGKQVDIAYVYRDPEEALIHGALPRAERMGRTVPVDELAKNHPGSFNTIKALQEKYANDPNVNFHIIDNSLGKGKAALSDMEQIAGKRYNVPVEELRNAVQREYDAGRISERTYQGTGGNAGAAEADRGVAREAGAEPSGEPQPKREESGADTLGSLPGEPLYVNPNLESTSGAAQVAGQTLADLTTGRGGQTLAKTIGKVAPAARTMTQPSLAARKLTAELVNIPGTLEQNYRGIANPNPIERILWGYDGVHMQGIAARKNAFNEYLTRIKEAGESPMSRREFMDNVSYAMRRGDKSEIPEVAKAAAATRKIVFQPLYDRAIKLGLVDDQAKLYADSYLTRQYDAVKIRQNLDEWMKMLRQGFQSQGTDPAFAADAAHKVTRNVLGSERGTMDWNAMGGVATPTKARALTLPDTTLEPFLTTDIDHLSHSYLRSMAPQVEMTERFGSRDMKDQFQDITDEYARMIQQAEAKGDPDEMNRLSRLSDSTISDLAAMRDRLYGIYGAPKDPGNFFVRAGRLARSFNALRLLGAATLSHFPDLGNVMMRYGMPNTFAGIARMMPSMQAIKLSLSEAQRMGAAVDMTMNMSASLLGDYGSHSQFAEQRFAAGAAKFFTIATGETPLITMTQALTSTLAQDELLRAADKIAGGGTIEGHEMARLASAGIDEEMLGRIAKESGNTKTINGLRFGMSDQWEDQGAAKAFESAVIREAHGVTLRPGAGDTPLLMSSELGKLVLQFKSFAFAANRVVGMPLAQGVAHGDVRSAAALMGLASMGALSYIAKQKAANQPLETDPGRLALEVLDKSNLMGWTAELIYPALWQAGFKNLSRWSDRDPVETLGGPTAGTVASTFERQLPGRMAPSGLTNDELPFRRSDLHFLRRMAPAQNLWYARKGINTLEDAIGDLFDLPGESNASREESRDETASL